MRDESAYQVKSLENTSFNEITKAWNLAFADYIVPINMTPERIQSYFTVSGVDVTQSYGVFYGCELIGMLINAIDIFRGRQSAYDAMTGIVPEHRNKGLFSQLFDYTKKSLRGHGITHYYLEVITTNELAFNIYRKKGGVVERELSCINGKLDENFVYNTEVKTMPLSAFPVEDLSYYEPSFSNRTIALCRNIEEYQVAYIEGNEQTTAVIFNKQGGIPQIRYGSRDDKDSLYAVLSYLSKLFENLRISNIPTSEIKLINVLKEAGFSIVVNQYEMCISLKDNN